MLRSLALLAALALASPAFGQTPAPDSPQAKAAAKEAEALKAFPPPGRMVDVGGRRLHLFCEGKGKGPTVIMEVGGVASSLYYRAAQDGIAKVARVCSYDRAGQGWSDPPPAYPRSLEARVDDLHALLAKAKVKGPYILAGHSMGGLLVRLYAHKYPKDVAGVVLIESSEEGFNGDAANVARTGNAARMIGLAVTAAQNGVDVPAFRVPNGPANQAVALRASVYRAGQDDMLAMSTLPQEFAKLGAPWSLGDTPLVVVTRGKREPGFDHDAWTEAHARLSALSSRSLRITAERSGHNVHADQPELYAEAVKQVLAMVR
jgi:pimeloyl-ACP methyl ester carboxylesterase